VVNEKKKEGRGQEYTEKRKYRTVPSSEEQAIACPVGENLSAETPADAENCSLLVTSMPSIKR